MANHLVPEPIPDSALLFRRIHRLFWNPDAGRVSSGAFSDPEMSVNWQAYATAQETGVQDMTGNTVAVVSLVAGFCRTVEQTVVHDPMPAQGDTPPNPAHTHVRGRKSKPIKQKLRDASVLVWPLG
jgi:hypothetical protein